ncbi:hypothetical protein QE359_002945 [Curtobacterium sp. SORGH_AS776]|nr:hypothetical protein [Curtobacterium sp. SORGH_AS_0776]
MIDPPRPDVRRGLADRVERTEVAHLEEPARLVEVEAVDGHQGEGFTGGVDEVVELADGFEERRDVVGVEHIECPAGGGSGELAEGGVDAGLAARGDDDLGADVHGSVSRGEADSRCAADDDDALIGEGQGVPFDRTGSSVCARAPARPRPLPHLLTPDGYES